MKHAMITAIAGVAALGAALAVSACGSTPAPGAASQSSPNGGYTPKVPNPATTTPTPPKIPPALSAGQQRFVSAIRARLAGGGFSNSASDAEVAGVGNSICQVRRAGGAQAHVIAAMPSTQGRFSMSAGQVVKLAERAICPAELPKKPRVLLSLSGSGQQNSSPVTVTSGQLTVGYSYDCSSFGSSGNFIADFETPDQSSLSSDALSIANALGNGGSATTTLFPQDVGSRYYLSIDSECSWTVRIVSP